MRYTSSQIAKLTGLSISGIRLYERAGVISPIRSENGKYRDFSLHELQLLRNCKQFRDCGFSIKEAVELINKSSTNDVQQRLTLQCHKLQKLITHKQILLDVLEEKARDFNYLFNRQPFCEQIQFPPLYYFPMGFPGEARSNQVTDDVMLSFINLEPITSSILIIPTQDFLQSQDTVETGKGLSINERYVIELGLKPDPWGLYIPGGECIRTIVKVNEDLTISGSEFVNARNYLDERNLEIAGPIFSRIFHMTNLHGKLERFDQLFIPVI